MTQKLECDQVVAWAGESSRNHEWLRETLGKLIVQKHDDDPNPLHTAVANESLRRLRLAPLNFWNIARNARLAQASREQRPLENLAPSELALHGLTRRAASRRHPNGNTYGQVFRDFIQTMVPGIQSEATAARVASKLFHMQDSGMSSYTAKIFEEEVTDVIRFKGTQGSGLRESQLIVAAGGAKTGEMVLHLFGALSDTDRAQAAFEWHNYALPTSID